VCRPTFNLRSNSTCVNTYVFASGRARTTSWWPFCAANINALKPSPRLAFTSVLVASSARTLEELHYPPAAIFRR